MMPRKAGKNLADEGMNTRSESRNRSRCLHRGSVEAWSALRFSNDGMMRTIYERLRGTTRGRGMKFAMNRFFKFCLWLTAIFSGILLILSAVSMIGYRKIYSGSFVYAREILTVILTAVCFVLAFQWLYKKLKYMGRRFSLLLFFCIVVAQVLFLVFVSHPMVISDAARVQNEALDMVKWNHGKMDLDYSYMQQYTNNHFVVVLFYYFYKILSMLGITEIRIPTIMLNIACIDIGIYITYRTAKRLKGLVCANLVLVFFLLCPTTYVWLTTAYTNTFSFPFVMAILYLCLWLRGGEPNLKNIVKCILLGFAVAVGYLVRPTTILPIIAMVLFSAVKFFEVPLMVKRKEVRMLNPEWNLTKRISGKRNTLIKMAMVLLVCGVTWAGCQLLLDRHIEREKITGQFPVVHWIMMGLNERTGGGFAGEDVSYTRSFEGVEAKKRADVARLKERVKEMWPSRLLLHGFVKLARVWAMGDDDSLKKSSYAHDYPILYEWFMGSGNGWFLVYMQAFRMAVYALLSISVLRQLRQGDCKEIFLYTLTFLGAVLFFLIWEANMKYNICFMGIYLILMADGTEALRHRICLYKIERKKKKWGKYIFAAVGGGCLIASLALQMPMLIAEAHVEERQYYNSRIQADSEPIDHSIPDMPALLEQTIEEGRFRWQDGWNCLGIFFERREEAELDKEYLVELIEEQENDVVFRQKIGVSDLGKRDAFWIQIQGRRSKSDMGYRLRLTHLGDDYGMVPKISLFPAFDPYPYGRLYVNGKKTEYDLAMSMYKKE